MISLTNQAQSTFIESFKEIEKTGGLLPEEIDDNVKHIEQDLYEQIIPRDLDKLYWNISPNIKSIQIFSTEPWILWEIIKPCRQLDDGTIEEGKFLCEGHAFCRWQTNTPYRIKKEPIRKVKVISPSDTELEWVIRARMDQMVRNKQGIECVCCIKFIIG